jgi:hypothetical protein
MVFDEVIFDQVLNPRYVAFCLKMEKKSPEGKKNERKKDIQEDNKMISTANILIVWQKDKMKLTKDYY